MTMLDARDALLAADLVCPHSDADGLAAGALALRARGEDAAAALLLERAQTPWGALPDLPEGASVAVLDQGIRPFARRRVLIDHHAPETDDPGPRVVSVTSFGEDRGGGPDAGLRALLRGALPDPREGDVGNGHPRATGGGLPPDEFERMLAAL